MDPDFCPSVLRSYLRLKVKRTIVLNPNRFETCSKSSLSADHDTNFHDGFGGWLVMIHLGSEVNHVWLGSLESPCVSLVVHAERE
jgi:hypothetical protein